MGRIKMDVDFEVNKATVADVKKALQDFQNQIEKVSKSYTISDELKKASSSAKELSNILSQSWNNKLNQLDLSKLNNSIIKTYGSVGNLKKILESSGSGGAIAFNTFSRAILNTNLQLSKSNKLLDDMADTMSKTVKWGVASSIFNTMTNSIQKAYDYTVKLDTSLNDIRIVTGKSADEMDRFAKKANQVAKDLGRSTKDFTEASLIYYQQGLGNEEAQARAEVTMKAANVTGQTGRDVSEQLTAVWNGYKVTADEAELYVDKLAAVAAGTAADLEELSVGMGKVASAANIMGVDIDQLNAQLATVVSVTRQAPESVGTAFKTIYARMGDIKSGLDDETTLGTYTEKMAQYGVNVLDANNNLRDMGDVIEEIGNKWTTLSREQQVALSQTMAGTRQYNNLLSLFDNWDMYTDALKMSADAAGTLQEQQDIYMESTAAHLKQLSTEAERTYDILFNQETVNGFADALTGLLGIFNNLLDGLGGGANDFIYFGSIVTNIFKKQIADGINNAIENIEKMKQNMATLNLMREVVNEGRSTEIDENLDYVESDLQRAEDLLGIQKNISNEKFNELNTMRQQLTEYEAILEYIEKIKIDNLDITKEQASVNYSEASKAYKDELNIKNKIFDLTKKINSIEKKKDKKEDIKVLQEQIQLLQTKTLNQTDINNLKNIENSLLKSGKLNQEETNQLEQIENKLLIKLNEEMKKRLAISKAIAASENGTQDEIQETYNKILAAYNVDIEENRRKARITELIQGFSTLTSLLTSVSGIIKTLNSEDLTVGEKAERIISVLVASLPMIIMNFSALKNLIPNLLVQFGALTTEEVAAAAAAGTLGSVTKAALLDILIAIAPVTIAIGLLAGAMYLAVKASQKEQEEINKMKAAANELSEQAQKTRDEINNIKNDFDKYKSVLTTLESCTKGTKEWEDALKNVNNSALDIIEKYPDLAKLPHLFSRIDGALTLNQSVLDEYLENREHSATIAQTASLTTSAIANKRQSKEDRKQLFSSMFENLREVELKYTGGNEVGIDTENINNSLDIVSQNFEELAGLSETEYKAKLVDLGVDGKYVETLMTFRDKVNDINDAAEDAAIQLKNTADTIAALAIGDKGASTGTQAALYSEEYQKKIAERQKELQEKFTGWGISKASGGDNEIYKEMLSQLQQIAGFENFQANQNGVRGSDSNRYFAFNVNGDEKVFSAEAIAGLIAENQIQQELSKVNYDKAAQEILTKVQEKLSVDEETADQIIQAVRDKDYNQLTEDTIKKIEEAGIKKEFLSEDELKSLGLEAGSGLLEGLNTAIEQWDPSKAKKQEEEIIKSLYQSAAKATEESEDTIRALVSEMRKLSENANVAEKDLIKVAKTSIIFNNNLKKLAESFSDNEELLKEWQNGIEDISVEAAKAVGDLKEKFDNLFDSDVSTDFLRDNLSDIEAMLMGDVDALNRLEVALGKEYILNINDGQLAEVFNEAENAFNELANTDLVIGASFDDEQALADIQTFFNKAKLSQADAQAVLNTYGYEGEFEEIKEPETTRTTYDEVTNVTYKPFTSPASSIPILDGNSYKMQQLPPASMYAPQYETMLVPHTETVGGNSYFVLKSKDGKGKTTGLQGSIKSTGAGKTRKTVTSGFSGYTPKSSGSSGRKGGGGSGSTKEPEIMKPLEKEADRYHDVDVQLDLISNDLDKLEKQKKKLFGKDLISNVNKQLNLLNKQIDTTNEKIKIAQGETQELQDKLSGQGVTFNADGIIANYADVYASQLNYVNSLIDQYNNMNAEAQESFKDTVEQAKEDFDKFTSDLDRYDELITDMLPGLEKDIQSAIDEKIDLQIEKFDMEIEIRLDLAEAERDWNDFKKKIIDGIEDDDILGNAMAKLVDFSSYYKEDDTGIVQALRKQVDNTLAELNQMDTNGWSSVYGDNRTAALEDLQKYYKELMTNLEDVLELQKEIHQSYMDMMDEAQEKFDEQIKSYEMITDLIDHDMKVISLVYGEESYAQLARYYDKQQQNFNSQLDFQRQQVDFWRQQLDSLEEGSDEWENAKEKWADAVKEMNSLIEDSIQNLQDKYLNAINLIFQNLNNKVTDGLGLDYIEEEWNLINKNADQYLDTINSLYEVQKLENKYLDALDQTDSVAAQRQLKKIMDEELADLRERDKLTQYDVERANRKYEIALKQIALQEAQQNKSKMRLRRDSQGNYRYEYTADGDQIGQLQDELNDMYNSLYNFDKARYQDNLNQMYDVWVEFQEKMAEAAQINDPVARSERELLLQNQYEQLINSLTEQNATVRENLHESAFDDLARLYDVDVANFQNMSDEEKETLMGDLLPYWESGVQHMTEVFAGEGGFLGVCKDAFEQLHDATKDYEDGLNELENTGRINFESIGEGIDENIDRTQQLITNNDDLINAYEQELTAIANVINELDDLVDKYNSARSAAIAATKAAYEYWSEQQREAAAEASAANSGNGNNGSDVSNPNANAEGSGGDSGTGTDGNLVVGETATFNGKYYYDSYGTSPVGSRYSGVTDGIVVDRITDNPYGIHIHSADGKYPDLGWIKKSQLSGYDTGGYTGTWGNEGRLALLHQKELVLNKEDTANMLNAINIMRNITNMLGSSVLGKLAAATAGNFGASVGNDVLEQNVHIDAQFPNVKDSREIEEALNNLVNMASMRANRR